MKVILLSDVKNLGKKDAVVEVADGYGRNYLIKNKLAVEATKKGMEILDQQKLHTQLKINEMANDAREVASKLEKIVLEFKVKVGEGGRVFGGISTKQICEELSKKHSINIDKRKFIDKDVVTCLGYSTIKVELFKDVIGSIRVHLSEK